MRLVKCWSCGALYPVGCFLLRGPGTRGLVAHMNLLCESAMRNSDPAYVRLQPCNKTKTKKHPSSGRKRKKNELTTHGLGTHHQLSLKNKRTKSPFSKRELTTETKLLYYDYKLCNSNNASTEHMVIIRCSLSQNVYLSKLFSYYIPWMYSSSICINNIIMAH